MEIQKLFDMTQAMAANLIENTEEEFYTLVDLRDEVLKNLQANPEISASDKQMLSKILELDQVIVERMMTIRSEASAALGKIQSFRLRKNAYDLGYSTESYFFDQKK
ncbi:flagellar protein FliT [Paenibacillus sp. Leaf72]|uniref:flagellar protein FliT n=1 Tax=Paenibacillus sp. Leaf72 TaxID=1736234 RepID=UPI0006F75D4B|nr:flagellar protein FliT [Paenibacillus sp. Leaf72]KQO11012.1 hypothetical protein ASF12_11620 [Paenibacillus sp. Leaf72]